MASKKLDNVHLHELEDMAKLGVTPEDLSKAFNISVSSVHNYKRILRDKGVELPDVRGKRPGGMSGMAQVVTTLTEPKGVTLNVNGVSFQISARAKSVNVEGGHVEVWF
jgi:transposase